MENRAQAVHRAPQPPHRAALRLALGAGGLVGIAFTKVLYGAEDLADRIWRGPEWLRPAVGGVLLGLVEAWGAYFYGDGYRLFFGLLAFLVLLVLRPQGLYGRTA